MSKIDPQPAKRRTEIIPVLTMVEVPVMSEAEKAEMIASLREAEEDIRAGRSISLKTGEVGSWLSERFAMAKAKKDGV